MQPANRTELVYFGRSQCSRQHAFAAFIHAGVLDADARRKADALPTVNAPAPVDFASPEPAANARDSEVEDALPAADTIASDPGMDSNLLRPPITRHRGRSRHGQRPA